VKAKGYGVIKGKLNDQHKRGRRTKKCGLI
jgi:hypothetical protein